MYETKTVLRTWYEMGWYEGWEVYGYTEFDSAGVPRMAEIRRPTPRAVDGGQAGDSSGQLALPTATNTSRWAAVAQ